MELQFMRKKIILLLSISFATGLFFFTFFTNDKSLENFLYSFLASLMYTFVLAFGNSFVNDYLNSKYSWIDDTRIRIILGVISTLFVNVFLVLALNYINFITVSYTHLDVYKRQK